MFLLSFFFYPSESQNKAPYTRPRAGHSPAVKLAAFHSIWTFAGVKNCFLFKKLGFANPNLAQPSFPTACQCSLHFTPSAAQQQIFPTRFTCKTQRTPKLCQVFLQQHELFFAFKIPQVNLQKKKTIYNVRHFCLYLSGNVQFVVCDVAQLQEQHDKHIRHTLAGSLKVTCYAQ